MAKKNKYDTDPLDPAVADRADQVWSPIEGSETAPIPSKFGQPTAGQTPPRPFADSEEPTRQFGQKGYTSYQSVFAEPPSPPAPPSPPLVDARADVLAGKKIIQPPTSRVIPGINLAENITLILPYIPFYVGAIAALIELFLVPRSETRVRFHAAQGLALHVVALAIGGVLGLLSDFSGARIGGIMFSIAAAILFVISMIRVWKGQPQHIAPVDDLSSWLNDKINPRK